MNEMGPKQLSEILEEERAALMAMNKDLLKRVRVSRERAFDQTVLLLTNIEPHRPKVEETFSPSYVTQFNSNVDKLRTYVQVFYAADLKFEAEAVKQKRDELVHKVHEHDQELFQWAWPLFRKIEELEETMIAIRKGTGPRNDADDTIKLVTLYRENWTYAEGKTPITAEYLNQASEDATKLINLLAELEKKATTVSRDLRSRAYTAWYQAYSEIRYAGRFVLRGQSNLSKLFPGVNPLKSKPLKPKIQPEPSVEIIESKVQPEPSVEIIE